MTGWNWSQQPRDYSSSIGVRRSVLRLRKVVEIVYSGCGGVAPILWAYGLIWRATAAPSAVQLICSVFGLAALWEWKTILNHNCTSWYFIMVVIVLFHSLSAQKVTADSNFITQNHSSAPSNIWASQVAWARTLRRSLFIAMDWTWSKSELMWSGRVMDSFIWTA